MLTPFGEKLSDALPLQEHPRPQMERENWLNLNGQWDYAITETVQGETTPIHWDGKILVPFSPEAPLSGVNRTLDSSHTLWYSRTLLLPGNWNAEQYRYLLHFDAVDQEACVYVNDREAGTHMGGYTAFVLDVTDYIVPGENQLVVRVHDDTDESWHSRGKQSSKRGGIWYTPQSGIWKSVWLEAVPESHIVSAVFDGDPATGILHVETQVEGVAGTLEVTVRDADGELVGTAQMVPAVTGTTTASTESVSEFAGTGAAPIAANPTTTCTFDIQIADARAWTPDDPYLYGLHFRYGNDHVGSYCAFRHVEVAADSLGMPRVFLNGEPIPVRGVLDQGYWPDGLMTAPGEEALAFDIAQMKRLGFNMMRKHIKIESERWYYLCDKMGMLVFQDMVSGGGRYDAWHTSRIPTLWRRSWTHHADGPDNYTQLSAQDMDYRTEWTETALGTVELLRNHPCIVTWVLFNEGWGQFDACKACDAVREADPTRPIDATSGWYDQRCGDFFSVHNYFRPLEMYPQPKDAPAGRAFALSEFGGITYHVDGHSSLDRAYGYDSFESPAGWKDAVIDALAHAQALEDDGQAVYVYTQLSDIEEETNGILTYDRRVNKFDL